MATTGPAAGSPRVSVIIPAHNVEDFIAETVVSVLAQRGVQDIEVLLVDDRSTDRTVAQAQQAAAGDTRLLILHNTGKQGAAGARNFGLRQARGEWVAFLDGDDIWEPDNLRLKLQAAQAHPGEQIVSSDFFNENACNRTVPREEWPSLLQSHKAPWAVQLRDLQPNAEGVIRLEQPTAQFIRHEVLGNTGTFMVKRQALATAGGFDESLAVGEDVYLWLQLSQQVGSMLLVCQPLMYYRYRPGSLTNQDYPAHAFFAERFFQALARKPDFLPYRQLIKARLARAQLTQSVYFRKQGQRLAAMRAGTRALRNQAGAPAHWRNFAATLLLR